MTDAADMTWPRVGPTEIIGIIDDRGVHMLEAIDDLHAESLDLRHQIRTYVNGRRAAIAAWEPEPLPPKETP